MSAVLTEESPLENIDNAFHEVDKLLEAWDDRLTVDNLAFTKRYIEGKLKIALEFSLFVVSKAVRKNYVAIFERILDFGWGEGDGGHVRDMGWVGDSHLFKESNQTDLPQNACVAGPNRNQNCVFIKNIELVKTPKGVCPSLVRLQPLDESAGSVSRAAQIIRKFFLEDLFGGAYWEIGILDNGGGGCAIGNHKGCGKGVERGPQIMNDIADHRTPFIGDGLFELEAIKFISGLRLFVASDAIWIAPVIGRNFGAKFGKMFLGPVNLRLGANKQISGHV